MGKRKADNALVSVIIPTYNRAHLVTETLDSVYEQTYRPIECIVVDDGSTDDTVAVVTEWKERHRGESFSVRLLEQENKGAPAARNHGLEAATGKYLLFLDSDDMLKPDALKTLQQVLSGGGQEAAYGDVVLLGGREYKRRVQQPSSFSDVVNMQRSAPLTPSVMVERAAVNGARWREDLSCAQEFAFFLDLALGGTGFSYEPTIVAEIQQSSDYERISNQDSSNYPLTISRILTDVESQIRKLGPRENRQYDRGLVHFAGILYRKGHDREAQELFRRANRGRALRSLLRRWRTSVFLPALLTPRWSAEVYKVLGK